jgi:hypothetical protein
LFLKDFTQKFIVSYSQNIQTIFLHELKIYFFFQFCIHHLWLQSLVPTASTTDPTTSGDPDPYMVTQSHPSPPMTSLADLTEVPMMKTRPSVSASDRHPTLLQSQTPVDKEQTTRGSYFLDHQMMIKLSIKIKKSLFSYT